MKILIADDHELFRDGLRLVLADLSAEISVDEACTYDEALERLEAGAQYDIILVDLVMPGMIWSEGIAAIKERAPSSLVVVLSASEDRTLVRQAVRLGAAGFIPKTSSSKVMISALQLVLSGGVYLPPALLNDNPDEAPGGLETPASAGMVGATAGGGVEIGAAPAGGAAEAALDNTALTPRQREVLALLGEGKSNKEIARVLNLSEGTVKLHVTAILKALHVTNRTGAVIAASRMGLTSLSGRT
ncbi:MAG: response regulator, partial [Rhodospirillaceae bacterium]